MRRWVKWLILGIVIAVVVVGIGLIVFFSVNRKPAYHLSSVEHNEYTVADFTNNSELKLYKNGTFHINLEHKTMGLSLLGTGTYTKDGNTYLLTFNKMLSGQADFVIADRTEQFAGQKITCQRTSQGRIKFIDPNNNQVYYFG